MAHRDPWLSARECWDDPLVPADVDAPPPASLIDHGHVAGPFFHGTRTAFAGGDLVLPGRRSHFRPAHPLQHVYFTTRIETAAWGAELAAALATDVDDAVRSSPRIYEVAPLGPFEDDPNVTDKRFPGNPTRSYRSREPLRVLQELASWSRHSTEDVEAMLASLRRLRAEGRDVVLD